MIYVFRLLVVVLYTAFWSSLALVVAPVDRSGESLVWIARRWARSILFGCGVRVVAEGLDHVEASTPQIFMSNHQSQFDILAIVSTLPVSFRFVAKKELTRIPVFGWALVLAGHVVVDRADRSSAVASLERAARRIRSGTNVIVFPEGTRSETGEMQRFKSGGFHLALDAQVAVVPVSISGSRHITPRGSLRVEPGVIKVVYGEPIPTRGLTKANREELKERVRSAIESRLDPALQGARGPGAEAAA